MLMWGIAYQGFNGVFPSLFPELFRPRVRVTGMAIGQNVGTTLSALIPALFVAVAPPGSTNIPLKIGFLTFGICLVAAFAAFTTRETYRIRLDDLGDRNATPVPTAEYERLRSEAMATTSKDAAESGFAHNMRP
jgi:Na+/melibiose symporter-like transporter